MNAGISAAAIVMSSIFHQYFIGISWVSHREFIGIASVSHQYRYIIGILAVSHRYVLGISALSHLYRYIISVSWVITPISSVSHGNRYEIGISWFLMSVSHRYRYRYLIGIGIGISSVSHRYRYRHLIGIGIGISSVSVSVSHRYRYWYLIGIGKGATRTLRRRSAQSRRLTRTPCGCSQNKKRWCTSGHHFDWAENAIALAILRTISSRDRAELVLPKHRPLAKANRPSKAITIKARKLSCVTPPSSKTSPKETT